MSCLLVSVVRLSAPRVVGGVANEASVCVCVSLSLSLSRSIYFSLFLFLFPVCLVYLFVSVCLTYIGAALSIDRLQRL